jgi:hypothetical protein
MERNREQRDAWHYALRRNLTLPERIWEALSSRVVFIVLGIVTVVMLVIALRLGVALALT